jgi:hydrogenase maturation protein HypF
MTAHPRAPLPFADALTRRRLVVTGRVQGVGFRPQVHRLATGLGLSGFVRNDGHGVTIEVEGAAAHRFADHLRAHLPPLARIDTLTDSAVAAEGRAAGFVIRDSEGDGTGARLAPDVAVCEACLSEMRDPANRRFGHAFIACTDCGPRFSMTKRLPYDRATTTMGDFPMCAACAREYADPASRRFHAEPICCPDCGPRLSHPLDEIVAALRAGRIVAIKGLGGYHLACDATKEDAVAALRLRKRREAKPFAVMVADVAAAGRLACVTPAEATLLRGADRPIVLLDQPVASRLPLRGGRDGCDLAPSVTMGLPTLGLFLPVTPLHALLFDRGGFGALVMTSANVAGDPIVIDDEEARAKLSDLADLVVSHDRVIRVRADDGVARVVAGVPTFIRRSRGQAPEPLHLARQLPPVIGIGAHLKATVAVIDRDQATLSAHVGDLDSTAAIAAHEQALRHLLDLTRIRPVAVGHDLHPDFPSTRFAQTLGLPLLAVQHHHAHALAVMAEHHLTRPVIALVLDGVGYGPGGEVWGGELLRVDGLAWQRLGHLAPLPLPGGDRAAREPWRIAAALLARFGRADEIATRFADQPQAATMARNIGRLPPAFTTSAGRLFDAAAALTGLAPVNRFEAEAAMRLEAAATEPVADLGLYSIENGILDLDPLMRSLADGTDPVMGANLFHGTFAAGLAELVITAAAAEGLSDVVLAGGCLANRPLTAQMQRLLDGAGLSVWRACQLPPGDGAVALGQAFAAGLAVECGAVESGGSC